MNIYAYRAITMEGKYQKGLQQANNLNELASRLQNIGLDLIDAHLSLRILYFRRHTVRRADLIHLFFNLQQLSRAGVPLLDSLSDLRDSVDDENLRAILAALLTTIENGSSLSQAMAQHRDAFDNLCISLIHAGEESGQLSEIFAHLADALAWQDDMAAHNKTLLIYPALLAATLLAVMIFMMVYLVPQLLGFLQSMGQEIPLQTRILVAVSRYATHYGFAVLALLSIAIIVLNLAVNMNTTARWHFDQFKLRLWLIGPILRKIILARFAHTFALMYNAGISILDCLAQAREIADNRAVASALDAVMQDILSGRNLTQGLQHAQLFPPLLIRMIKVGESSGTLGAAMLNVGHFYDREVRAALKRAQILLEPAMTLLLGLILGWIMLAVLAPIYDLIARIRL